MAQGSNGKAQRKQKEQRGNTSRTAWLLFLVMLGVFAVIRLAIQGVGINHMHSQKLDDQIRIVAIDESGKTVKYGTNQYRPLRKGSVAQIRVPLPTAEEFQKEADPEGSHACLCFYSYNTYLRVYYRSQLLYTYGKEERKSNQITGHIIARIAIPDEAMGGTIHIIAEQLENNTSSIFQDVYLVDSPHAWLYPLIGGGQFEFCIFITFLLMAVIMLMVFCFMRVMGERTEQGILLSLFCILISLWDLGYSTLIYLLSDNMSFNTRTEYLALYCVPIAFFGYMIYEDLGEKIRTFYKIACLLSVVLCVVAMATEIAGTGKGYSYFLFLLHVLIAAGAICTMIIIFTHKSKYDDLSKKILRYGMIFSLIICIFEVVRTQLTHYISHFPGIFNILRQKSFAPLLLIVFEISLIMSYILRLVDAFNVKTEKEHLQQLAYDDVLTGIPNRTYLREHLEALDKEKNASYTIFFLDVNNLKEANDRYGHDMGDKMLIFVSRALRRAFDGIDGFYGRYGGDEFVACVYDSKAADRAISEFYKQINKTNVNQFLPIPIEAAVGSASSSENASAEAVLHAADEDMYRVKAQMKGGAENVR